MIHRDIEAANLILNPGGTTKIIDFGMGSLCFEGRAKVDRCSGTPGLICPTYAARLEATLRIDAFAFGVVLFELRSTRPAFVPASEPTHHAGWCMLRYINGSILNALALVDQKAQWAVAAGNT